MSKVAEGALLLPLAIATFFSSGISASLRHFVPAVIVAAILALANFAALTAAYRRADLSLVYPVARGGVFLGWRLLRESLTPPRMVGSALITTGCLLAATI